jgi:SAM-dependent methyltransferase
VQHTSGRRYFAPLENPKRAIDIGTGTGTWLKEMAVDFPECQFLGIDLNPSKLKTPLPANCTFEQANALEGIPHPDGSFDYVRSRFLVSAMPKDAWAKYIKECVRLCAPGGWIEIVETDVQFRNTGPCCEKFNEWIYGGMSKRGIDIRAVAGLESHLKDAGLINVTSQIVDMPFGHWGGVAGELFIKDFQLVLGAFKPLLLCNPGVTEEAVEANNKGCFEEMYNGHVTMNMYIYTAQKPLA